MRNLLERPLGLRRAVLGVSPRQDISAMGHVHRRARYHAPEIKPFNAVNPFKLFAPMLKMLTVEEVGASAIRSVWSDGLGPDSIL
jgi:hypothetical protein